MGTNYYVQTRACGNACEHCAQATRVHLGKSSAGWLFLHRAYVDEYDIPDAVGFAVRDRTSWLKLLDLGEIFDEYNRPVDRDELLQMIDAKQGAKYSHSIPGPHMGPHYRSDGSDFSADGYDFCSREFS